MRVILIILFFAGGSNILFGQSQDKKIDTFYYQNGLVISHLLLSHDSTFYIITGGCVEAGISKGKWQKRNGKINLEGISHCETELKTTINTQRLDSDREVRLTVLDVFGSPFRDYTLILLDSTFKDSRLQTDSNGTVIIKKGQYVAFYTQHEEQALKVGDVLNDKVHYMWDKQTRYTVNMNYPSNVLMEREITRIYHFSKKVFLPSQKKLVDAKNKAVFTKL